jgi:hypothetical protein
MLETLHVSSIFAFARHVANRWFENLSPGWREDKL